MTDLFSPDAPATTAPEPAIRPRLAEAVYAPIEPRRHANEVRWVVAMEHVKRVEYLARVLKMRTPEGWAKLAVDVHAELILTRPGKSERQELLSWISKTYSQHHAAAVQEVVRARWPRKPTGHDLT